MIKQILTVGKELWGRIMGGPFLVVRQIPFGRDGVATDPDHADMMQVDAPLALEQVSVVAGAAQIGGRYVNEHVEITRGGDRNHVISAKRIPRPIFKSAEADDGDHVSAYNWDSVPIGICPVDARIGRITVYQETVSGGVPLMKVGNLDTADEYIGNADAISIAGNLTDKVYQDGTGPLVSAGDYLVFGSSGGTTSSPSQLKVEVELIPEVHDQQVQYVAFGAV